MPMPMGGAVLIGLRGIQRRGSQGADKIDPELEKFREQQRFIKEHLKCTIDFGRRVIPAKGGKVEGVMVLEAEGNVDHSGLFILMKGIQQAAKRKSVRKPQVNVKFTVLGSTLCDGGKEEEGGEPMVIEAGSQETYPLELDIPGDLPPPVITAQAKLIYRMQLFISTVEGRHVGVGEEMPIRWRGYRMLTEEEMEKPLRLEQPVTSKREYFGLLGRRKVAHMEWRVERGGYLPGEMIPVEFLGETKESGGMEVECRVELVQKVWYQVRSTTGSGQMWGRMKVNVLSAAESEECVEVGEGEKKVVVWRGSLAVPRGITPTFRHNFNNSVSYTIRASSGLVGDNGDDWVTGEVPVLIGTCKEGMEENEEEAVDEEDDEEIELEEEIITSKTPGMNSGPRRGTRRSRSATWMRPRSGSFTSTGSVSTLASSTLSMFRMPPSYSQLSSRRPTVETLPPPYWELELEENGSLSGSPEVALHGRLKQSPSASAVLGSKSEIDDDEDDGTRSD